VIPSRTRPRWKEQFGRVIIEANASGVPIVGSDSGAIPALIGVGGLVFPEGDAAALATHLQTLLDDPSIGHALGAAGRDQVLAKYTQAQVAAATVAVYEAMMGR
jgi:glycosyltransferase involved in cell wall biosynthesis